MPQSILVQVGQCGNQIGGRFWDLALQEHAKYNSEGFYDEALSTFFRNVDSGCVLCVMGAYCTYGDRVFNKRQTGGTEHLGWSGQRKNIWFKS